ncbi:unnamed protein product [Bursaphelenchus okinawaensis]|uniref:ShKT domain-containing protein n=1 Tax=Bursaphelenchus okinawaensis TaxID=465554 RepID=A0A811KXJ2_9BILA|nr:unnamed protein product [Bursaphelenchus okinawaensis]CAG9113449.1 unnamed protein product [Bursaphelenchus okinawaensis]
MNTLFLLAFFFVLLGHSTSTSLFISRIGRARAYGSCTDKLSDCQARAHLCDHPLYVESLTNDCRRTCKRCDGNSKPAWQCKDSTSNCKRNKYLCQNPPYVSFITDDCPVTCGFCKQ